jgi:stalled ribosome alternative rescue factor ArfA
MCHFLQRVEEAKAKYIGSWARNGMEHDRDYFREYESKFCVASFWCYNVIIGEG